MFQNTVNDLQDCYDALCDGKDLSDEEQRAKRRMLEICRNMVDEFDDDENED